MAHNEDYIVEILQDVGLITGSQLEDARANANDGNVLKALVEAGVLTQEDITRTLAAQNGMEFVDLSAVAPPPDVLEIVKVDDARRYRAVPIALHEDTLVVAVSDPLDMQTMDDLSFVLNRDVEYVCATPDAISKAIQDFYGTGDENAGQEDTMFLGDSGDIETTEGDAPIIKMVSMLLLEAYNNRASDIHLEPLETKFRVRFRIDGVLQEMQSPPKKLHSAIISRLKIMSGSMSIAEKRIPQDGRIQVKLGQKALDLRVSSIPTVHGESIVMRILDKTSLMLGLPDLGFLSDDQLKFERLINLPDGILLVTGPTGSGKTTTLYASLHYMNKPDRKIITVEDPVEYQLSGINQVPVNAEIGMTFPAALRSILRQAPNIIMIGEIRDMETASIAINASLTGHLVLSTLHTNDAPGAIARLVDIGIKPFLVSSSVRAALAQRLVRRLCPNCKQPTELTEYEARTLRIDSGQLTGSSVMKPHGCESCRGKGYKGRRGIFELFQIDDEVRHMIINNATTVQLRARARELGMRTLREDGIRKVLSGMTTAEEVITTTMTDSD
ncbi:type II secretion system protein E [Spartobacteria bacterium LR76]|nr:type II secretion system protein E [Spartobacteria bacterium LR76]